MLRERAAAEQQGTSISEGCVAEAVLHFALSRLRLQSGGRYGGSTTVTAVLRGIRQRVRRATGHPAIRGGRGETRFGRSGGVTLRRG